MPSIPKIAAALLCGILSACADFKASQPDKSVPGSGSEHGSKVIETQLSASGASPIERPSFADASSPQVRREFSAPGAYLGPLPTLLMVLKPYDQQRNLSTCTAFMKQIPSLAGGIASTTSLLAIRWPLTVSTAPPDDDCGTITGRFDYFLAGQQLEQIRATTANAAGAQLDASGPGPFVIEQYATAEGIGYIVLDFSRTGSADFGELAKQLATALAQQGAYLKAQAPAPDKGAGTEAAKAPSTLKGGASDDTPTGKRGTICKAANSWVAKVLLVALDFVPGLSGVISTVDTIDKAGCGSMASSIGTGTQQESKSGSDDKGSDSSKGKKS